MPSRRLPTTAPDSHDVRDLGVPPFWVGNFPTFLWGRVATLRGVATNGLLSQSRDQLDRQDAYPHYRPLSRFLADVSFAGLRPVEATVSDSKLRAIGYQGKNRAYVWLADRRAIWWNLVVDKQKPAQIKGATIEVDGFAPGLYRIEWWHTFDARTIRSENISLAEGALRVIVPSFSRDVACKITAAQ